MGTWMDMIVLVSVNFFFCKVHIIARVSFLATVQTPVYLYICYNSEMPTYVSLENSKYEHQPHKEHKWRIFNKDY